MLPSRTATCLFGLQWMQSECVLGAEFFGPPWLQLECVFGAAFTDRGMSSRTALALIVLRLINLNERHAAAGCSAESGGDVER